MGRALRILRLNFFQRGTARTRRYPEGRRTSPLKAIKNGKGDAALPEERQNGVMAANCRRVVVARVGGGRTRHDEHRFVVGHQRSILGQVADRRTILHHQQGAHAASRLHRLVASAATGPGRGLGAGLAEWPAGAGECASWHNGVM